MLKKLQKEHKVWLDHNFGGQPSYHSLLGVVEEVGELSHAHLKNEQGIRTNEDHIALAKDAIADIVIFLASYCNSREFDFEEIIQSTWNEVKKRDWIKFPKDGINK